MRYMKDLCGSHQRVVEWSSTTASIQDSEKRTPTSTLAQVAQIRHHRAFSLEKRVTSLLTSCLAPLRKESLFVSNSVWLLIVPWLGSRYVRTSVRGSLTCRRTVGVWGAAPWVGRPGRFFPYQDGVGWFRFWCREGVSTWHSRGDAIQVDSTGLGTGWMGRGWGLVVGEGLRRWHPGPWLVSQVTRRESTGTRGVGSNDDGNCAPGPGTQQARGRHLLCSGIY